MKSITVTSANHKYRAIMRQDGLIYIRNTYSSFGNGWEKSSSKRVFVLTPEEIIEHNSDRFSFTLHSTDAGGGWAISHDSINCEPFKKIQEKVKEWIK